jgi:hypothetical protein
MKKESMKVAEAVAEVKADKKPPFMKTSETDKKGRKLYSPECGKGIIFAALVAAGKDGITLDGLMEASEKKKSRVKFTVKQMIERGLAKMNGDKIVYVP